MFYEGQRGMDLGLKGLNAQVTGDQGDRVACTRNRDEVSEVRSIPPGRELFEIHLRRDDRTIMEREVEAPGRREN